MVNSSSSTSLQVRTQVRECRRCSLAAGCRGPVAWDGDVPCDLCVVGEAPGREEDKTGRPFVGPSGSLARSWVVPRFGPCPYLNVVSCFPNRTPTGNEVEACRINLFAQLRVIEPKFILVFGGIAVSVWTDHRIGEVRGRWFKAPVEGLAWTPWAMATWHPAAVLRNRALQIEVLDDLRTFRESVGSDGIPPYVYQPCIKCGSVVGTHVTEQGIAWCAKHWAWKIGTAGRGRSQKKANKAKPSRLF